MSNKADDKRGLTAEEFKRKLDELLEGKKAKIWLAKSAAGRVDVIFSAGDAQGKPIRNVDHIGGFYLMGEDVPREYIDQIHQWFLEFTRVNFTPHRLERHFIDTHTRAFYELGKKYHEEIVMHVPFAVHGPTGKESG